MCIAILNRSGVLSKETFITCHNNNPDSMGLVYAKRGKLYIKKELDDVDKFYSQYEKIRKSFDGLIAIHFRIGTSGKIDLENCHPFLVNSKLAIIHNGVLSCVDSNKTHCDTWHFAELLKKIGTEPMKHKEFREFLAHAISPSKMVFLTNTGRAYILNFDKGVDTKDNWFSNNTYKEERYSYSYDNKYYSNGYWSSKENKWIPYEKKKTDKYDITNRWQHELNHGLDYYDSGFHFCRVCGVQTEFEYGYCTTCGSHFTDVENTIKDLSQKLNLNNESEVK